jgi:hypothetical protein
MQLNSEHSRLLYKFLFFEINSKELPYENEESQYSSKQSEDKDLFSGERSSKENTPMFDFNTTQIKNNEFLEYIKRIKPSDNDDNPIVDLMLSGVIPMPRPIPLTRQVCITSEEQYTKIMKKSYGINDMNENEIKIKYSEMLEDKSFYLEYVKSKNDNYFSGSIYIPYNWNWNYDLIVYREFEILF